MTIEISAHAALSGTMQDGDMLQAEEVVAMLRLHELGWGSKRLSKEFGCARNTVRRYLREGGAAAFKQPVRRTAFDGLDGWLRERFFQHDGNADVIRQELASEHGIVIGLRSVELRVQPWRRELQAQKRATIRFETAPGHQMQIDFGDTKVWIGGERVRIHLFVGTLGYSRRLHTRASLRERQADWFEGMEGAFLRFGGVPAEVLIDNAKALVEHHDAVTREVRFNARLHAFARYWGFTPRACAPYRARTKGKDERGVGYVKKNAIAAAGSRTGRNSKHIWIDGRGRSLTGASTARRASRRQNGLATKPRRCVPYPTGRRSDNCGIWFARFSRIARSTSTRTATQCPGA
jgi:transposase